MPPTMSRSDRVNDYRDISDWSYNLGQKDPSKLVPVPEGWSVVNSDFIKDSEFGAAIFRNDATKEIVVAFRGTDPSALRDQVTNLELFAKGHKPREYEMAERYMEQALADMPEGYQIRTTGHSQGAGMAHYMGLKHDIPSVGFNTSPGNIYLNNIYETLPESGTASHIDLRSSMDGSKGLPMLDSDTISGGESPITHPAGMLLSPFAPKFVADTQFYMDPIAGITPVYLKTGCNDAICHSLSNFGDKQLEQIRQDTGQDILPNEGIIGGDDKFKACFPTRDVTDGVTLGDSYLDEIKTEAGKAADVVVEGAQAAGNAIAGAASAAADKVGDALDAVKDAAGAATDWTTDKASGAWNWTKDKWNKTFGDEPAPTVPSNGVLGYTISSGSGASQTITAIQDEGDAQADEADSHADRSESAAKRARVAARRAAAARARMQAMIRRS